MNKKIIYKFTVKKQEEVEEESTTNKKNKETGEMEKVTTTKKVKKDVPYDVIIYQPSRRQVEDADMEFSIEMSRCIKKGVLTKAMLAKKYSDSGGLLTEDDSNSLMRLYRELSETQESLGRLLSKKERNKNEQKKADDLTDKFTEIRKQIVDLETTYQTVFNHTADTKAQNKTILWYMLHLSYIQAEGKDPEPLFAGSTNEEKEDSYYEKDENGDEIFDLSKEKLMTFISYWYFSQNPSEEDFQKLEEELDEGSL